MEGSDVNTEDETSLHVSEHIVLIMVKISFFTTIFSPCVIKNSCTCWLAGNDAIFKGYHTGWVVNSGASWVANSYVPSCQQHLIIMRYSCRHCQRIDFVELTQAPMASPGLDGPLSRANGPIERV